MSGFNASQIKEVTFYDNKHLDMLSISKHLFQTMYLNDHNFFLGRTYSRLSSSPKF